MNEKISTGLGTAIIVIIAITVGVFVWIGYVNNPIVFHADKVPPMRSINMNVSSSACTREAKICPDGSSVGRTGPNCEFANCLGDSNSPDISTWKTYKNVKYGFEFKYPKEWGPISTEMDREAISGTGEEFYILFANSGFHVSGVTSDYGPWEEISPYKGNSPMSYCKEREKEVSTLDGCKEISNDKASITYGYYSDMSGLYLTRDVFIKNSGNKYSGITIAYKFNSGDGDFGSMSESQIKIAIKNKLKEIDQNSITTFDKIISTFKFTK